MKVLWLALFFAFLLCGSFYMGYLVAIDIFEFFCFTTSNQEPTWLHKLLRIHG